MAKRSEKQEPTMEQLREAVKAAINDKAIIGDGHGLYYSEMYLKHFSLWEEEIRSMEVVHRSSGGKWDIHDSKGEVVPSMKAIWNLSFLGWLVNKIGLQTQSFGGRGSQAREYCVKIYEWANSATPAGTA